MNGGGGPRRARRCAAILCTVLLLAPPIPDASAASASASAADPAPDAVLDTLIDTSLRSGIAAAGSPRVVLGISTHGQHRFRAYGGTGDGIGGGTGDRPLDPDSIVEIGSITKVFTTALLAETADAGL
ncbi:MAG: serine hydrolase, partial [Gluconacetobacter diazotrophicus]|nr:serine hydrolase [Gluconacetobacter diazotrophicus]